MIAIVTVREPTLNRVNAKRSPRRTMLRQEWPPGGPRKRFHSQRGQWGVPPWSFPKFCHQAATLLFEQGRTIELDDGPLRHVIKR